MFLGKRSTQTKVCPAAVVWAPACRALPHSGKAAENASLHLGTLWAIFSLQWKHSTIPSTAGI